MRLHRVTLCFAHDRVVLPALDAVDAFPTDAPPPGTLLDARDEHLHQRAWLDTSDGSVHARYVFDEPYARAHPEALDAEHLALLHGTLAAKLLDDGAVVLDREGLAASLRWRPIGSPGTRLGRDGSRRRGI